MGNLSNKLVEYFLQDFPGGISTRNKDASQSSPPKSTKLLMGAHSKFILMVQPVGLQGAIWQAMLRSQEISVTWESPDVNLPESFKHLAAAKIRLPDLLMLDTRLQKLNPYHFCRWSKRNYPTLKIVLLNGAQSHVTDSEREWAIYQGAAELFPRFQQEKIFSGGIEKIKRVLELLGQEQLDHTAVVTALLQFSQTVHRKSDCKKLPASGVVH
jgi:CheY-like chemotaxis protein